MSLKRQSTTIAVLTTLLLLATALAPACRPLPPAIRVFTAIPSEISAGESATLRWQVEGATSVTIDQGVGNVPPSGATTVSPPRTLAYTITASNRGGTVTKSVVIYVTPSVLTPPRDTSPPVVKDVNSTPKDETTVVISWVTDEPATCKLEYGKNTQYGDTVKLEGLNTTHSVTLQGLDPNTIYHFRIAATDEAGNETVSSDNIFTTPPPKSPFSLVLHSLEWGRRSEFEGEAYGEGFGRKLIYLKGAAQNNSNATLRSVMCTMHCWSGSKLVKSEVYVYQAPILPGHVFKFEITTIDDPSVDNVTIEFADHLGRQMRVTQK